MMVVVPLALGVVLMYMYFGRQGFAAEGVTHAAAVAARAASMERDQGAAQAAASTAANTALAESGRACTGGPRVSVSASGWEAGGVVNVTVTCVAAGIGDIGAPSRTFTASARATIDYFWGYDE